jgi:SAM-dependent methyltransferase
MKPADYDAWYDSDRGRWIGETEYRLILERLAPRPGDRLLDVGCGTGWFTRRLAAMPGLDVMGIDLDPESLAFARGRDPRASYARADALRLPFADNSFERVLSVTALCFVKDWPRALAEIVRVTDRRFAVGLLNRRSLLWRGKGRSGGSGAYQGAHWHTRQEILGALAGLPVVDVRIDTAVLLPGGSRLARLAERFLAGWIPLGSFLVVSGDRAARG